MTDKIAPGELMNEVNALTRERDELRVENDALQDQAFDLTERLFQCSTENERLRAALEQISRESGQVCPDFETCSHGPCQGSLAGKLIALEALTQ